jgi:hypothetical protein
MRLAKEIASIGYDGDRVSFDENVDEGVGRRHDETGEVNRTTYMMVFLPFPNPATNP